MKSKPNKVHRNFKLDASLNRLLVRESQKSGATQTWIVEQALKLKLATK